MDGLDLGGADDVAGCLVAVAVAVLLPVLVIVFAIAAEWLALLAVLPFLVLARTVFGRPWLVTARPAGRRRPVPGMATPGLYVGQIRGWRASRGLISEVAAEISRGGIPRSLQPGVSRAQPRLRVPIREQ
jgi:hypothetical protein